MQNIKEITINDLSIIGKIIEKQNIPLSKERLWQKKTGEIINMNVMEDEHLCKALSSQINSNVKLGNSIIEAIELEELAVAEIKAINETLMAIQEAKNIAENKLSIIRHDLHKKETIYGKIEHVIDNLCTEITNRNIQDKFVFNKGIEKGFKMDIEKKLLAKS
tara:strand:+ start:2258 stop:2746 length:489 start_codon:yes stop_codon:yes gene_type:complete